MDKGKMVSWIDANWNAYLEDTMTLMRIPSVSVKTSGKHPFGKACADVLDSAIEIGRRMGFQTENHEYYCASIVMPGTGSGEIGIFAHMDVVPEGTGWTNPPYEPCIKDGWLFGRGSADDKAPAVAALYAMKLLQESGIQLRHSVRMFLGANEENGMEDIQYYVLKHKAPDFSFTPDAPFSVCFSEKGIIQAEFSTKIPDEILEFTAGTAANAVAGSARVRMKKTEMPYVNRERWPQISVHQDENEIIVEAEGRSAHAAFPEGSVNAAAMLAGYLCESGLLSDQSKQRMLYLYEKYSDYDGAEIGIEAKNEELGDLTAVMSMVQSREGKLVQAINIRYPATQKAEDIYKGLHHAAALYGWTCTQFKNDAPSYMPPDHPMVCKLDAICREHLGDTLKPYAMGGGTYARHLPNAVGYGPNIRGMKKPCPQGHGGGHQPDECANLCVLRESIMIYARAMVAIDTWLNQEGQLKKKM